MLIQFTVSNFLSFKTQQSFSMRAGKYRKDSSRLHKIGALKLTKFMSFYGLNASGKSNLVSAISFMQKTVVNQIPGGYTASYYKLSTECKESDSLFEVEILLDKTIYRYGFSAVLSSRSIISEYLYKKSQTGEEVLLYRRNTSNNTFEIGDYFKKENDIAKMNLYKDEYADNNSSLFLTMLNKGSSSKFEGATKLNALRKIYAWFQKSLTISDPNNLVTRFPFFSDSNVREIKEIIGALGIGINDIRISKLDYDPLEYLPRDTKEEYIIKLEQARIKHPGSKPALIIRRSKEFYILDLNDDGAPCFSTIELGHENSSVFFKLNEESDGTARLLDLIELFFTESRNKVFVIDEIDRCLYPTTTVKIIDLFLQMARFRNTQLIATTHESRLLSTESNTPDLLRNDEIQVIYKDKEGASFIETLDKYNLRSDKSLYSALFDGSIENTLPKYDDSFLQRLVLYKDTIEGI